MVTLQKGGWSVRHLFPCQCVAELKIKLGFYMELGTRTSLLDREWFLQ